MFLKTYKKKIYLYAVLGLITLLVSVKYFTSTKKYEEDINVLTFFNHKNFINTKEFIIKKIKSPYQTIKHEIKAGESVKKILKKYEIDNKQIDKIINLQKKYYNPNKIFKGKFLTITTKKNDDLKKTDVLELSIPITKTITVDVYRNENNELVSKKNITKIFKKVILANGIIKNNLYSSAIKSGMKPNTIIEFARIYGFEIDFQRDIRKNDKFQILYEKFYDENDEFIKDGSIIHSFMSVDGREISLYRFGKSDDYGYFDSDGKSVEKALMKTPINGARLSSSFGMRKHPILGYNKKHLGTDFAAPEGTPIMASGSGTIIRAKWCGGGGNCIKIKHNSTYQTVYAHMKSFARGMKVGRKVRQGEIIGYVGSTGMSTGPHLHYEVIINGKKVNSQKLKLPSGKILKGEERKKFEIERIKTDVLISELIDKKNN